MATNATTYANNESRNMGFFDRKKQTAASETVMALIDEPAEPEALDQNAVLSYLTDLSDDEYKKLCKVAEVYRKADKQANEIMGKVTDGERIEVRVVAKPADDTFIETDTQVTKKTKGTTENAKTTK